MIHARFRMEIEFDEDCDSGTPHEFVEALQAWARIGGFHVVKAGYSLPHFTEAYPPEWWQIWPPANEPCPAYDEAWDRDYE